MKRYILLALLAGIASAASAHDAGYQDRMVVGGILGSVIGAMIGNDAGGRDGAILGSAIGAAAGVTLATHNRHRSDEYERVRFIAPRDDYYREFPHGRGWHRGHHNHHHDDDD